MAQIAQGREERFKSRRPQCPGIKRKEAEPRDILGLLRPRRKRPRRRAAKEREEVAASDHSITSSARASTVSGTSRPIALAVLRLIMSSNLVGCSIGSSEGLAPFRIRPV